MVLRVRYNNLKYDYVQSRALDMLIKTKRIYVFYRPSEKRWVRINHDPMRGEGICHYIGKERRRPE
jgi:hypothetical protein